MNYSEVDCLALLVRRSRPDTVLYLCVINPSQFSGWSFVNVHRQRVEGSREATGLPRVFPHCSRVAVADRNMFELISLFSILKKKTCNNPS